jgi:hypothetical protein
MKIIMIYLLKKLNKVLIWIVQMDHKKRMYKTQKARQIKITKVKVLNHNSNNKQYS